MSDVEDLEFYHWLKKNNNVNEFLYFRILSLIFVPHLFRGYKLNRTR